VLLHPDQYDSAPVAELLKAAACGSIGIDHRFLRAILDRLDQAAAELARFGVEQPEADPVQLEEDLIAIFRYRPRVEAVPFLMQCLRREPQDIRDDVLDAILRLGEAALEPLFDLYRELGPEEGTEVAFLLASLGVRDQRILELLLALLERDPAEAAMCLGAYGDAAAKPELERLLEQLDDADDHGAWAQREVRDAISRLENPEPAVELEPYDIFEDYPETAMPRFELLSEDDRVALLASPLAEYREPAAASFRNSGLSPEAKARLFETARNDPAPPVRAACWESLAGAAVEPEIHEAMAARLRDASAPLAERAGALVALADRASEPDIRRWILEFYDMPATRAKAVEAMWRSLDRDFGSLVAAALDDPDADVRRQAILGVGYLSLGAHAGRLRKLFDDDEYRTEALQAYALASPGETSRYRMRQLFNKMDEIAGGLSDLEEHLVQDALNLRLDAAGLEPISIVGGEADEEAEPPPPAPNPRRNDPCPCGSGKKHKKCCGA